VALLVVISGIMLLTVLVTEIARGATVRVSLAANHRDEIKAEAIARSGVHLYQLVLMASKALGRNPMVQQFGQMMGVNGDSLWMMAPKFNSGLIRMVFVSGPELDELRGGQGLTDDQRAESREGGILDRNFLDFDGDFHAEVSDEASLIYVGNLQAKTFADLLELDSAQKLQALMMKEEHQQFLYDNNLEKLELIGNLVDWTDADEVRLYQGGYEESLYQSLEHPYPPKNAPFDTRSEIRLVDGWHLDGVWRRFGKHLTIYGDGKVNVNTAERPVLFSLFKAYMDGLPSDVYVDQVLDMFLDMRGRPLAAGGVYFSSAEQFKSFAENQLGAAMKPQVVQGVTTEATVFRVKSVGEVGDARAEILAVFDFSSDKVGKVIHWKVR
jgi:type II secretory pathway component PulK